VVGSLGAGSGTITLRNATPLCGRLFLDGGERRNKTICRVYRKCQQ